MEIGNYNILYVIFFKIYFDSKNEINILNDIKSKKELNYIFNEELNELFKNILF